MSLEPPGAALRIYEQGIIACERLGLPVSCLRVYYREPRERVIIGVAWDGTKWVDLREALKRFRDERKGAWAEFETLDEAKMAGATRKETKLYPLDFWGPKKRVPRAHPAFPYQRYE